MTDADTIERELIRDLATLGDRFADDRFAGDLYRALAGNALSKEDLRGHVSLSWRHAEEIVNNLRAEVGREALELAQSGDEGAVAETVADELRRLGWHARTRDTSRHDDAHVGSPPDPPPADQGQRRAPAGPLETDWEQRAHEEADAGERLMPGRPGTSAATRGRDPEERAHPSG
ncbi:MAG TPA: hypothetical protein VGV67_03065 [Solirubrobacteraceae bacterium]|nr:hypothetical protein [Solirubrobacteraceae bacterium]